jgi:hypothetical protein
MLLSPISIAMLSNLTPQIATKTAAFQSLFQQLGGSISTAALVTLLARREACHQVALAQNVSLGYAPVREFLNHNGSIDALYATILCEASALSYADCQFVLGVLAVVLLPVVLVLPKRRRAQVAVSVSIE